MIAQGGPGDEVRLAATYDALRAHSAALSVTCDPRLRTLLQRSFPDIELVPVARLDRRRPGGAGPGSAPRSGDALFTLLTSEARALADRCDGVLLATALHQLTLGPEGKAPYDSYVRPQPELVARVAERWPVGHRRVGVVWRSEFRGPDRDLHYLSVTEAARLLPPEDLIVCLQHDATAAEREQLTRLSEGRVEFVDDIDLRNDFESTAALLAGLDLVLGVGTTMTDLSGALGTTTLLRPAGRLGAWRATDAAGHDFWHRGTLVVAGRPPSDRQSLLDRVRSLLAEPI